MGYVINCRREGCGRPFMKFSNKATDAICISCRNEKKTNQQAKKNKVNAIDIENKSKAEIITLLEKIVNKQADIDEYINGALEVALDDRIDEIVEKRTKKFLASSSTKNKINTILQANHAHSLIRTQLRKIVDLQNDHMYWKSMVKKIMNEIEEEE